MPTITINKSTIITSSSYEFPKNTDCSICRQHLNNDSIYAVEKCIQSTLSTGICGHMFHNECITHWLIVTNKCPLCVEKYI